MISIDFFASAEESKRDDKKDPLYDSDEDNVNAAFTKHLQKVSQGGQVDDTKTDAVLNCPGCMSLLCLNCQRHSKYKTQYRTMFTFNCKVVEDGDDAASGSNLPCLPDITTNGEANSNEQKDLKRVLCEICNTPVGVMDSTGVYHLFGVLASHA